MIRVGHRSATWYQPACDRCYRSAPGAQFDSERDAKQWVGNEDESGEDLRGWLRGFDGYLVCPECIEPEEKEEIE